MTETSPAPRTSLGLPQLVGDTASFNNNIWNTFPYEFRPAALPALSTVDDVWNELSCGLLVRPWVSLTYPHGLLAAERDAAFQTRLVVNNELVGYPNPVEFARAYGQGSSVVMDRPELWHSGIAELLQGISTGIPGEVWSTLTLAPPAASTAGFDVELRDDHVFILQLAGRCTWSVQSTSDAAGNLKTFDLEPGGVLYVPPGSVRGGTVGESDALVLIVCIREITAERLAEITSAMFMRTDALKWVAGQHNLMSSNDKISWLREAFGDHLAAQDPQEALQLALRNR